MQHITAPFEIATAAFCTTFVSQYLVQFFSTAASSVSVSAATESMVSPGIAARGRADHLPCFWAAGTAQSLRGCGWVGENAQRMGMRSQAASETRQLHVVRASSRHAAAPARARSGHTRCPPQQNKQERK